MGHVDQSPQLHKGVGAERCRLRVLAFRKLFSVVVHLLAARLLADRLVVREYGLRGSIDHLLDRSQGYGEIENRSAYILDHGATVALGSGQFCDEGSQSRPVAGAKMLGDDRVVDLAAAGALALV